MPLRAATSEPTERVRDESSCGPTIAGRVQRVVAWLAWWLALFLAWLAFVDNAFGVELLASAVAATTAAVARAQKTRRRFAVRLRQFVVTAQPIARVPSDFWLLLIALGRRPESAIRRVPTGETGSTGLRALAAELLCSWACC